MTKIPLFRKNTNYSIKKNMVYFNEKKMSLGVGAIICHEKKKSWWLIVVNRKKNSGEFFKKKS
jgi:hypothetical protein